VLPASLPGGEIAAGRVTVVVRPEHSRLGRERERAALSGRLETVVYFGTDTHYHLRLPDGGEYIVRRQNSRDSKEPFRPGDELGIGLGDNAVRILKD